MHNYINLCCILPYSFIFQNAPNVLIFDFGVLIQNPLSSPGCWVFIVHFVPFLFVFLLIVANITLILNILFLMLIYLIFLWKDICAIEITHAFTQLQSSGLPFSFYFSSTNHWIWRSCLPDPWASRTRRCGFLECQGDPKRGPEQDLQSPMQHPWWLSSVWDWLLSKKSSP